VQVVCPSQDLRVSVLGAYTRTEGEDEDVEASRNWLFQGDRCGKKIHLMLGIACQLRRTRAAGKSKVKVQPSVANVRYLNGSFMDGGSSAKSKGGKGAHAVQDFESTHATLGPVL
jgi:hypothetical protein